MGHLTEKSRPGCKSRSVLFYEKRNHYRNRKLENKCYNDFMETEKKLLKTIKTKYSFSTQNSNFLEKKSEIVI